MKRPRWILTDIEGTTTSIAFVHDVLFPYARQRMREFLRSSATSPEIGEIVSGLQSKFELQTLDDVASLLDRWMTEDKKETELKLLQGMLWRHGYEVGDFTGHVYPDVAPALERWRAQGLKLAVYSSGSVAAQKLLFGCSDVGDLDIHFEANFDTGIGHKRESNSYRTIVEELESPPDQILFLSDIGAELQAAKEVGLSVLQLMRSGNTRDTRFEAVENFKLIDQLWR